MRGFGLRGRLTLIVSLGAVVTLAALTIGFNLLLRSSLDADANRLLQARAEAVLETIDFRGRGLRVTEDSGVPVADAQVWVFAEGQTLERPRATPQVQRLAASLAGTDGVYAEDDGTDTRLYSMAVEHSGRSAGTVVSGISLQPYERSASRALVGSLIFAAAVLALIVAGVRWVVGGALRPVVRMTAEAADWSEHDIDHRFNVGEPTDELTALAHTFDRMLDRVAEALRHEQRFTAEVSHELRTPLAAVIAEAEVALRRERSEAGYRRSLEAISARARQLERILETLLAAARAESQSAPGSADALEVAERVVEHQRAARADDPLRTGVVPPHSPLRVAVDGDTAERILSPIVENAWRHAAGRLQVLVGDAGPNDVTFTVLDDGPGVAPADRERIFEPGYRVRPEHGGNGAGLGLPLARRLARAVGGDVACELGDQSGGLFVARLPRA